MTRPNNTRLLMDLTDALNGSVPERRHNDVLAALKRCQELLGRLATTIADLDVDHSHSDLMFEAKLYANVLTEFFGDVDRDWFDLTKGYDPREYLVNKGVIKPAASDGSKSKLKKGGRK